MFTPLINIAILTKGFNCFFLMARNADTIADNAHINPNIYWNCASPIPSNRGPLLSVMNSNNNAVSSSRTINRKKQIFLLFILFNSQFSILNWHKAPSILNSQLSILNYILNGTLPAKALPNVTSSVYCNSSF